MKKFVRVTLTICIIACAHASADAQGDTRYSAALSNAEMQPVLLNLALWEDGRVTGNGRLFEYLKSPEALIRQRAVQVIGRIQDPQDVDKLIPLLADADEDVVLETVFALGQIGSEKAVAALVELDKGASTKLRIFIAEALGKIGGAAAVATLAEQLHAFNGTVRGAATLALARTEDPAATNSLLIAVHDGAPDVVWKAVYALEKVESDRAKKVVLPFLSHDDVLVRSYAARTLGKQNATGATDVLINALADKDPAVVINAANALGTILADRKDGKVVEPLGLLLRHPSHHIRKSAAMALGSVRNKNAKDYLVQSLLDPSPGVRIESYKSLANVLGDKSAVFLGSGLKDSERLVRAAAVESFGIAKSKEKISFLVEMAQEDTDPMMRAAAVRALSNFDRDDVAKPLEKKLEDDDWVVTTEAVTALGKIDHKDSAPALMQTYGQRLSRVDVDIRLEVLSVLTDMKIEEAQALALQALEDTDKRVRLAAVELLESIEAEVPQVQSDRSFYEKEYVPRKDKIAPPFGSRRAAIKTSKGVIEIELFGDDATQTVKNFIELTQAQFFDGKTFHRVVPNFVIQGGCPRGDGWGDPGYNIRSEFNQYGFDRGYVGMAHAGKDTGGCQFFITHSPQPHLNGRYTIFGRVTKGMDVVDKIDQGDTFNVVIVE